MGARCLVVAAVLVVAACGGGSDTEARSTGVTAEPSAVPTSGDFSQQVDIGGGRHVRVTCSGSGSPVVLFESGDESGPGQWSIVQSAVAQQTRACSYDRLGNGLSDPATGCRGTAELRGDLEALLRTLRLSGPYVLVGTSGGGYLVANFAYAHPDDVAGIVLVETHRAIIPAKAPPELLAELDCNSPLNQEHRDYVTVENDAWSQRRAFGALPLSVITNDFGQFYENDEERTNIAGQKGWLVLSTRGRQVVVRSGHNVPENEPDTVTTEIQRVLAEARAS